MIAPTSAVATAGAMVVTNAVIARAAMDAVATAKAATRSAATVTNVKRVVTRRVVTSATKHAVIQRARDSSNVAARQRINQSAKSVAMGNVRRGNPGKDSGHHVNHASRVSHARKSYRQTRSSRWVPLSASTRLWTMPPRTARKAAIVVVVAVVVAVVIVPIVRKAKAALRNR